MRWAIDVSKWDAVMADGTIRPVNWARAKNDGNISTAIIKVSEAYWEDRAFYAQWNAAHGIVNRVAYHFFRCNYDAQTQAEKCWGFLDHAVYSKEDRMSIDFETTDGVDYEECLSRVHRFLLRFVEISGIEIKPYIYTSPSFWRMVGGEKDNEWAKEYSLWLAQWVKDYWVLQWPISIFDAPKLETFKTQIETGVYKPKFPLPWTETAIWQFTSRADTKAVPGHPAVKKVVDYDVILNDPFTPPVVKKCECCGQIIPA